MEVMFISTSTDLEFSELKAWLKEESTKVLKPLNNQAHRLVDKVRERIKEFLETCRKLEDEGIKQAEKGRTVRKAKATQKLSRFFMKQIDKISFPNAMSFSELDNLHRELDRSFSMIVRERNLWFPRISPLFIITRRRIDIAISRLSGSISELSEFLTNDYSKAKISENLAIEVDQITVLLDELSSQEKRRTSIEAKVESLQKIITQHTENLESTRSDPSFASLAEVNQRILELKKQAKHELRHLRKPLIKFANLTREPAYALSSREVEMLSQYIKEPFTALADEEEGCPALKSILGKLQKAMDDKKLKLKSSRLRKGQEKIKSIVHENSLNSLQTTCSEIYNQSRQLTSSTQAQTVHRKSGELEKRISEVKRRIEAAKRALIGNQAKRDKLTQKVDEKKEKLVKQISENLGKHLTISF